MNKIIKIEGLPGRRFELKLGLCVDCEFQVRRPKPHPRLTTEQQLKGCHSTPCGSMLNVREVGFDPKADV